MEKRLNQLEPGEEGVITRVTGEKGLKRRLLEMGLTRGTRIRMIRKAPLGDPIEFQVKGYNLSLRKSECEGIYVSVEEKE